MDAVKAIPTATAQEWVSIAYVEVIAAQAGLNIKNCRWDDGVDMDIGSNKALRGFPRIPNLYISLQLKSTVRWEITDGHIHYPLKASNYEKLRDPDSYLHQFLVLYTMPSCRSRWIQHNEECSRLRDRAYYLSLRGLPALAPGRDGRPRVTKTVRVPVANRLTACSLLGLYRTACEEVRALRGAS